MSKKKHNLECLLVLISYGFHCYFIKKDNIKTNTDIYKGPELKRVQ